MALQSPRHLLKAGNDDNSYRRRFRDLLMLGSVFDRKPLSGTIVFSQERFPAFGTDTL